MTRERISSLVLSLLVVFASVALAAPAFAQSKKEQARGHFEQGAALYYEGEYARALVEFKRGNAIVPNAIFIYNIALCHLKLERYEDARADAIRAREMGGLPKKESTRNEARIDAIDLRSTAVSTARMLSARADAAAVEEVEESDSLEAVEGAPSEGLGTLGWIGVAGMAAGAATLGVALLFELELQGKADDFDAAVEANETERARALREDIISQQDISQILVFSGAGLAAMGTIFLIVDLVSESDEDGATGSLAVTPDSVGVVFEWPF